jgi:hypothetical protein
MFLRENFVKVPCFPYVTYMLEHLELHDLIIVFANRGNPRYVVFSIIGVIYFCPLNNSYSIYVVCYGAVCH